MRYYSYPDKQGLYDPEFEHSSCGVGFLCNTDGRRTNDIIKKSFKVLRRIAHRGAVGADPKTGDGAGILIQIPDEFFQKIADKNGIKLPRRGDYASGLIFFPQDKEEREFCRRTIKKFVEDEGQVLLGFRCLKVNEAEIGETARRTMPQIEQVFIERPSETKAGLEFERALFVVRRQIENIIYNSALKEKSFFYITNLSSLTFSYKGLLMPHQLESFFPEVNDPDILSSIVLVHSRYSTNTFPTWDLSQPFRLLAHNGEINTLRGNINWMRAREGLLQSKLFGSNIDKIKPILREGLSDSATLDNALELLVLGGRSLAHSMMMLIPPAWENDKLMDEKIKDFYRYHACFCEPWDGPAAIAFTDGVRVGAVLDRNGLRPARVIVTRNNFVVMASEVGVLDIPPEDIVSSTRLEPGKIFYIDTEEKRIVDDREIKGRISQRRPYSVWVKENMVSLDNIKKPSKFKREKAPLLKLLKSAGFTREDLKFIVIPMARDAKEPTGSMGRDIPPAVLSKKPRLLYEYFKQLFAQVTNPAIDSIREEIVMSLKSFIGVQRNILDETPLHAHKLRIKEPILTDEEIEAIRNIKEKGFKTKTISILFNKNDKDDFRNSLERISKETEEAIKDGYSFVILSDRGVNKDFAALPDILAVGAVHHYLVKKTLRTQIGIILETSQPRETHHFALLFGYGADCINPYLAYQLLNYLVETGELAKDFSAACADYRSALNKGILKILSKMGISTLSSYRGAQIFEALGIGKEVIDRCFRGTVSRIGGIGFEDIRRDVLARHSYAYPSKGIEFPHLATGGIYQWKKDGECHLWNPETIFKLQTACRNNDFNTYQEFSRLINDQSSNPAVLRGLLKFKHENGGSNASIIPLSEVEPKEEIVKRFVTGAMSFGAISRKAHETLAIAMNRLGGKSNTGEGGEDPLRFKPLPNGDSKRSAVKQVASGRFGVTANYLTNADELQIKIAQGAKPGEGGQLPGHKVSVTIARTRYTTPGVTLISPPPHHDIYSIEDLAQLIFDLKNANPRARISVKLVSEVGVGTIAAGVAKGHADMILISGGDGGTGASPRSSIMHAGLPWELGLSETHQTLVLNDLRSRVRLQTDGQMRTGRDIAIAAALGAEEFGFCTSALVVLGCVMERHCNLNSCSVGIATQDNILESRFKGRPEYIINYFYFVAEELRQIMAKLGIKHIDELVGRTDFLEVNKDIIPYKARNIDYSRILYKPEVPQGIGVFCQKNQNHGIDNVLDRKLINIAEPALKKAESVKADLEINNTDRTAGAMLSGEVCRRYGEEGLPDGTIRFNFKGVAGQSFGAFLAKGITFCLEGLANDYVGKGISGGKIIIYPDKKTVYNPRDNIIIGNTTFYGAIKGEAYIRGKAGERFCIRNSGLYAVVEGVGDHGCEYMTGGRVVIIGRTGRNFAAGMSGGIAYIYDEDGSFSSRCNLSMVELEEISDDDREIILDLLNNHFNYTKSETANKILSEFDESVSRFVKVMPLEYKRILETRNESEEELGLSEVSDG